MKPKALATPADADAKRDQVGVGGAEEDRTPDLLIANEALSQLSYGPTDGTGGIVGTGR
jgi:hypothetical protein